MLKQVDKLEKIKSCYVITLTLSILYELITIQRDVVANSSEVSEQSVDEFCYFLWQCAQLDASVAEQEGYSQIPGYEKYSFFSGYNDDDLYLDEIYIEGVGHAVLHSFDITKYDDEGNPTKLIYECQA